MVESFSQVRKAVVGAVAAAVVRQLAPWVNLDVTAVTMLLDAVTVGLLVWAVPNSRQYVEHDDA
jgi:hypothetical protein